MPRLFVGLSLPASVRAACLAATGDLPPGWAAQDDDQLHLTVRFIGEIERWRAEDVAAAIDALSLRAPVVGLDGVGWFDQGPRGALFARAVPRDPLATLHRKIDRLLIGCGLPPEGRAYFPHVTLARRRSGAADPAPWLERHAGLAIAPAAAPTLALFDSRAGHDGSRYTLVSRARLNG